MSVSDLVMYVCMYVCMYEIFVCMYEIFKRLDERERFGDVLKSLNYCCGGCCAASAAVPI
jgi:hypothetical protein